MRIFRIITVTVLLLVVFVSVCQAEDKVFVTRVVDGDTIEVNLNNAKQKVRLIGIDTPETVHPSKPVQYFGKEASAYTKLHLLGKNIELTYDWQKYDRYHRLLAYVWINGELFNLKIILNGYAFAYLKYPFRQEYMNKFKQAENYARIKKLGLWADQKGCEK